MTSAVTFQCSKCDRPVSVGQMAVVRGVVQLQAFCPACKTPLKYELDELLAALGRTPLAPTSFSTN